MTRTVVSPYDVAWNPHARRTKWPHTWYISGHGASECFFNLNTPRIALRKRTELGEVKIHFLSHRFASHVCR